MTTKDTGGSAVEDFEAFATRHGASRGDIGEAGLHKSHTRISQKQWARKVQAADERNAAVIERRDELRREYAAAIARGEIRPPTRRERLRATADGHDDNESVQAARRLLAARTPEES